MLEITDPNVLVVIGKAHTRSSSRPAMTPPAPGTVFDVTDDDLVAADNYEVDDLPPHPGVAGLRRAGLGVCEHHTMTTDAGG